MSSASFLLALYLSIVAISLSFIPSTEATIGENRLSWVPVTATPPCQGSIEECIANGEFGIDSESHRRILATSQYISYRALQRNTVPCSRKGASYYNCQPGAEANPYTRGCDAITRCRNA